jgi:hypothetical protein
MADSRYMPPRRVSVAIYLHAGEVADILRQRQLLQSMSDAELKSIAEIVNAELATRGDQKNEPQ